MPKFDCEKSPSTIGPKPYLYWCQRSLPGHPAHAGAQQLAVRQHDLEAADRAPVVLHRRAAAAALERIAEWGAPAGIGRVDPDVELVLLDVTVEVEVADAGLDDGEVDLVVHLEHSVHALEIDDHAARVRGRRRAVAQVPAGRDRPERDLVLVRDPHDRLHLLDGRRRDRGRREPLLGLAPEGRVRVAVELQVIVGLEYPVGADRVREFLERGGEVALGDVWGYGHGRLAQKRPRCGERPVVSHRRGARDHSPRGLAGCAERLLVGGLRWLRTCPATAIFPNAELSAI